MLIDSPNPERELRGALRVIAESNQTDLELVDRTWVRRQQRDDPSASNTCTAEEVDARATLRERVTLLRQRTSAAGGGCRSAEAAKIAAASQILGRSISPSERRL